MMMLRLTVSCCTHTHLFIRPWWRPRGRHVSMLFDMDTSLDFFISLDIHFNLTPWFDSLCEMNTRRTSGDCSTITRLLIKSESVLGHSVNKRSNVSLDFTPLMRLTQNNTLLQWNYLDPGVVILQETNTTTRGMFHSIIH